MPILASRKISRKDLMTAGIVKGNGQSYGKERNSEI
jgi:hypothetical protein